jgi:hypothetical protein
VRKAVVDVEKLGHAELRPRPVVIEVERRAKEQFGGDLHLRLPPCAALPALCEAKGETDGAAFGFSCFGFFFSRLPRS